MTKYESEIYNTIEIIVRKIMKEMGYDITLTGKVLEWDEANNRYLIEINDNAQWLRARSNLALNPGDLVYIRCVKGNLNEKYIDCKKP